MEFKSFSAAVATQFQSIQAAGLFQAAIGGDDLWRIYLESFPAGSNPIFKTRAEHDCTCCRRFIKTIGGTVALIDGKVVTIWDVSIGGHFQVVADALAAAVRARPIANIFLHTEPVVGTGSTRQLLEDKTTVRTWHHLFVNLPRAVVVKGEQIGPKLSDARATHDVMKRGLEEIGIDSIDIVLDLIAQNSLYRGEEQNFAVAEFRKLKATFKQLPEAERDLFVWRETLVTAPAVARFRNTVIGTLLTDLSEGKDLEDAVKSFEAKVAPTNYKRPTALVTKAMIARAQETVNALGFATALERRYATIDDITINNILFADRSVRKAMNVFAGLAATKPESSAQFEKVETVSVDDFLGKILPTAQSVEVLFENRHVPNLVSLIAPADPTARSMFKWPNNFSWSYNGELADSIKERVKQAGGNVTGDFRASLSWHNYDDLDLHLVEPGGGSGHIYYGNRFVPRTGGSLDVDMNAGMGKSRSAVENIVYPDRRKMLEGSYQLAVNNFAARESVDIGFEVEMEFGGDVHSFSYPKLVRNQETIVVAEFRYTHRDGLKITNSLPSEQVTKTAWGVATQAFHRVNVVMVSPNHWDEKAVGNRHYFFMLDGCRNEGRARGFFNEFLCSDLDQHRKVLEVVGARMRTEESDRQLSGLGFSSTQRQQIVCRVSGSFSRVLKVLV